MFVKPFMTIFFAGVVVSANIDVAGLGVPQLSHLACYFPYSGSQWQTVYSTFNASSISSSVARLRTDAVLTDGPYGAQGAISLPLLNSPDTLGWFTFPNLATTEMTIAVVLKSTSTKGFGVVHRWSPFSVHFNTTHVNMFINGQHYPSASVPFCNVNSWAFVAFTWSSTTSTIVGYCKVYNDQSANMDGLLFSGASIIFNSNMGMDIGKGFDGSTDTNYLTPDDFMTCLSVHFVALNQTELLKLFFACQNINFITSTAATETTAATTNTNTTTQLATVPTTLGLTNTSLYPSQVSTTTTVAISTTLTSGISTTTTSSPASETLAPIYQVDRILDLYPDVGPARPVPLFSTANILPECSQFNADRSTPTPQTPGQAIPIQIAFQTTGSISVSNVDETISLNAFLLQIWKVPCPWNSTTQLQQRPFEDVFVADASKIWKPRLRFTSSSLANVYMAMLPVGDDFTVVMSTSKNAAGDRDFMFFWSREGQFTSDCSLEFSQFPFDQQTCSLDFSLERSNSLIEFANPLFFVDEPNSPSNDEWRVVSKRIAMSTARFKGFNVSTVSFILCVARKPDYFITNIVLPTGLLSAMNIANLLMPPDVPDRATFTVTILLALTMAQGDVTAQVPIQAGTNLLSTYVRSMTWFSCGCLVYELFATWVACSFYNGKPREMPRLFCRSISLVRLLDIAAFLVACSVFAIPNVIFFTST